MSEPQYKVFEINMNAAGSMSLEMMAGIWRFIRAEDASGAITLEPKLEIRDSSFETDWVPLSVGNAFMSGGSMRVQLQWEAFAGVTAYLFTTWNPVAVDVDASPPANQIVGGLASGITASADTVGVAAASIVAVNASRKTVTIFNNGTVDVYLGADNTVTTANGLPVAAGSSFTFSGTTAAIWAISGTAGQDVRILEEG